MKIAICDDRKEDISIARKELERITHRLSVKPDVFEFSDADTMVEDILSHQIEVVLLDIDMPEVDGLEIANDLTGKSPFIVIIFLTNRSEFVFMSLRYRPLRFIRKNRIHEELEEAILAAEQKIASEIHMLCIKKGHVETHYPVRDVLYIESNLHYIEIHTNNGIGKTRGKISDYERKLEEYGFIRIHVGYLVNIRYIKTLSLQGVILDNEEKLPVSRKNINSIQDKYTKELEKLIHGCNILSD